jgi:hypothetical protein
MKSFARRQISIATLSAALMIGHASAESAWPQIELPTSSTVFPVDDVIVANGLPMRLTAFSSRQSREQLMAWFRQSLGEPLVENRLGDKIVLGQAKGEHYLTIQLESTGTGTRGVAAVSHLKSAYDQQADTRAARDLWLQRLPSGSRILSRMSSSDRGQRAEHLVFINNQSESANRDALRTILENKGFSFERETVASDAPGASRSGRLADARTLYFKGKSGEAMATVARDSAEKTVVVLNTISSKEGIR